MRSDVGRPSAKSLQITSGRAVRRIVDMFASVSDLVAENTRRLESDLTDEDSHNDLTIECVHIFYLTRTI